jgi:hypothetical protein
MKVLRFFVKQAPGGSAALDAADMAKGLLNALAPNVVEKLPQIAQDKFLGAVAAGDVKSAATVVANAVDKHPETAKAFSAAVQDLADQSKSVAATMDAAGVQAPAPIVVDGPGPAKTPQMPVPGNITMPSISTRPGPKVKPAAGESAAAQALASKQATVASPEDIKAAFSSEPPKAGPMPKTPSGKPLTAAERQARIKALQLAAASNQDIFAAFGLPGGE